MEIGQKVMFENKAFEIIDILANAKVQIGHKGIIEYEVKEYAIEVV